MMFFERRFREEIYKRRQINAICNTDLLDEEREARSIITLSTKYLHQYLQKRGT